MSMEPWDEARSGFIRLDDLVGRALLIYPRSTEERESNLPGSVGKRYTAVIGDCVVLSGPVTEVIPQVPLTIEGMFFSSSIVVSQIKFKIGTGRPVLGVLGTQKASNRNFKDAFVLNPDNGPHLTDEHRALARKAHAAYLAAKKAQEEDPFAVA
jgi:hypothetical protein